MQQRRYPPQGGYSLEQARELAALSCSINRQIGLLLDRQGRPQHILVGTQAGILIPALARSREATDRLRGLRLLHTHVSQDLLSQEDTMDLLFLRLDSIQVLTINAWGEPLQTQRAHVLPPNPEGKNLRIYPPQPWDDLSTDFAAEVTALEEELARATPLGAPAGTASTAGITGKNRLLGPESRAILVSVGTKPRSEQEAALAELAALAATAGVEVAGTLVQRVPSLNPQSILGKGKLAELEVQALQGNSGLIIMEGELSPAQLRNLTAITERRVLDRTQLILDIFAQRARSQAGKYQVELAQLEYMLPRLVGKSRALDRLAGGIGGRGPGETKLETDRRRLRDRVTRIKRELETLRQQRAAVRARRAKGRLPVVALVGYTNAGKSTLLNSLTGATVLAEDRLFATLDPTTRRLRFPQEREIIITDTVGFIRRLPKQLIEAFRATLEELEEADLLLHVADAASPDLPAQIAAVEGILEQLNLHTLPRVLLLNKAEMLGEDAVDILRAQYPGVLCLSARTGQGLSALTDMLIARLDWGRAPE